MRISDWSSDVCSSDLTMSIKVGDKVPAVSLKTKTTEGIQEVKPDELFGGKTVVLFALPGALTPTCSAKPLLGYVTRAADLQGKRADKVDCLSVNDAFVMDAWGKYKKVGASVLRMADGTADSTERKRAQKGR